MCIKFSQVKNVVFIFSIMTKRLIVFYVLVLYVACIFSKEFKKCNDNITETFKGAAYWKFRGIRYTASENILCWKNDRELSLRECDTTSGQWQPENIQCIVRESINDFCPDNLLEMFNEKNEPICFNISEKPNKYNINLYHGSDIILPVDLCKRQALSFVQTLYKHNISEFWLPMQRDNNSMPFTIRLPGSRWGETIEDNIKISNLGSAKNCLSIRYLILSDKISEKKENIQQIIKATDCEESLYSISAYGNALTIQSVCPLGYRALSYRPRECYGLSWKINSLEDTNVVRIKEYFQKRNIFRAIFKNIQSVETKHDSFVVDDFVDRFGDKYIILINRNGMVKVNKNYFKQLPVLYKKNIDLQKNVVQMKLKFDTILNELILIVYNGEYLWRIDKKDYGVKCFTNADYDIQQTTKIDLIWENKSKTKTIYKLKLRKYGPGEYWCEGHTILDFNFVTTDRIVAIEERRGHTFATRIKISCFLNNKGYFTNMCDNVFKNMKKIGLQLQKVLCEKSKAVSHDLVIHNVRIMSVEQISTHFLYCWVHLSAILNIKQSGVDNSVDESIEEDKSMEDGHYIRNDTLAIMHVWNMLKKLIFIYDSKSLILIRSTEYCFPRTLRSLNNNTYKLKQAIIGEVGTLSDLCIQRNGMPFTLLCKGNFVHGAYWEEQNNSLTCQSINKDIKVTQALFSLENSKMLKVSPGNVIKNVKKILHNQVHKILPIDIHFTANIIQATVKKMEHYTENASIYNNTISEYSLADSFFMEGIRDLIVIYNYLADVKEATIKMCAKLNSTNKLLESFENAMNYLSTKLLYDEIILGKQAENHNDVEDEYELLDYMDIGVSVRISSKLLYFTINPIVANISGIAIFRNGNNSENIFTLKGAFKDEYYRFLQFDHEIEDFIYEPDLQFGTYVPQKLLKKLNTFSSDPSYTKKNIIIVIKVYSNDILFQSIHNNSPPSALGRIVSISLPGFSTQLPEDLPLVFRDSYKHKPILEKCNYWNYENWVSDGITISSMKNIVLCQVSHLTPFAYLVGFNLTVDEDIGINVQQIHGHALDIITVTGCSLSLLGVSGIFITAVFFQSWRQKPSSKVLLHLSVAIALQMILICFVNTEEYALHLIINEIISNCVVIGALLHYSILVQFFWMITIAYLQFKRYVQVFRGTRTSRFLIKTTAFCWGIPVIPVLLVAVLDYDSFSKGVICYPSGYALYIGIILPISIIIITNFFLFCLIIYNILIGSNTPMRHSDQPVFIYQIRLSVLLFFLLGFTWCFGVLSSIKAGIVFSYLFCLTATLQGFVIFIYFIILDSVTRRMWATFFRRCGFFGKNASRDISTIKNSTTQLD